MITITPDSLYKLTYNNLGVLECANLIETGETVWVKDSEDYPYDRTETAVFLDKGYDLTDKPEYAYSLPS